MGNAINCAICYAQKLLKLANGEKAPDHITDEASQMAPIFTGATSHMLVLALDYPGTGNELTCTEDGDNMCSLAQQCGITSIMKLYNNEANKEQVLAAIQEVGGRCQPGDYFIFNYSGHGANVADKDGDEDDGQDEALCLVTPDGRLDWNMFLTDDEFAEAIGEAVDDDVNILILCDCCHSGTIGDFQDKDGVPKDPWIGKKAISMSGCRDSQTSGDTGRGGIFTHALLLAIEQMKLDGNDDYSVGQLYNVQLDKDDAVFHSAQDITVQWTAELEGPQGMAWPMVPDGPSFTAPWSGPHS